MTEGLQSGFVIAVLIGAVFLAERMGGDDQFARRATQVAMAIVLSLTVFAGTTAFLRGPDLLAEAQESGGFSLFDSQNTEESVQYIRDAAHRASESGTIHLGFGIGLVALGVALFSRFRVLPAGLLLGGILLLLLGTTSGGSRDFLSSLTALYGSFSGGEGSAGQARDIIRFVVLLAGSVFLLGFTFARWELPPEPGPTPEAPIEPMM